MTEPKKRGRPKGSGGKKKADYYADETNGIGHKPSQIIIEGAEPIEEMFEPENLVGKLPFEPLMGINPIAYDDETKSYKKRTFQTTETPYPSNWQSLSKVDKLSWLTAHRKK